jgi:small subunit ribosomal protein S20
LRPILRQDHILFLVQNQWRCTLANTAQAKKRARQAEDRRGHNASMRSEMRTYLKKVTKSVEEGNSTIAKTVYQKATSLVDRLAGKGLIHANKAARHKSRLNAKLKALAGK